MVTTTFPLCEQCAVRDVSIFQSLTRDEQEHFSYEKGCNYYKKGQLLFNQGGKTSGIFCIHKGKIKVYKAGAAGRDQILRIVGPGEILGYGALLSNEANTSSAEAIEDSVVCFIPKNTFLETLDANDELEKNLKNLICKDLKEVESSLVSFSQKQVRERLAESLLLLKTKFGVAEDGETLNVRLTREEIANLIGTATESAIRLLSELQKDNIIGLDKRYIQIKDAKKLYKIANLHD